MTTILLVEDAVDLAQAIRRALEGEGYQVMQAGDGLHALELHSRVSPDLIILDWMLPKMDGLDVLRQIRTTSSVPILMLTARSQEIDRVIGLEVGADDYLTKPFSMRELVARVRALLRRIEHVQKILSTDRERGDTPLSYGPLYLEPLTYQVRLGAENLDLTRTEFDLLHLLLQHPGRVFSRTYLRETVWGEYYLPGDRSVDNAVLRLRKKLGDLGNHIESVWGVGYRLKRER